MTRLRLSLVSRDRSAVNLAHLAFGPFHRILGRHALDSLVVSALAKDANVGPTKLTLPPPTGYCELDAAKAADARAVKAVEDMLVRNRLLVRRIIMCLPPVQPLWRHRPACEGKIRCFLLWTRQLWL